MTAACRCACGLVKLPACLRPSKTTKQMSNNDRLRD
jgi:hypothetical protein